MRLAQSACTRACQDSRLACFQAVRQLAYVKPGEASGGESILLRCQPAAHVASGFATGQVTWTRSAGIIEVEQQFR